MRLYFFCGKRQKELKEFGIEREGRERRIGGQGKGKKLEEFFKLCRLN